MKKILFFSCLVIIIPVIVINFFVKNREIKFHYSKDMYIRVLRSNNTIENIDFENYIVGVVASEMPASFDIEALKAQAVASRSYAMVYMARNSNNDYDVVDTVSNQVYKDYDELKDKWKNEYTKKINKIKQAVIDTSGEYLDYNGEVVEALFFSTSTGVTENSEEIFQSKKEYLRSVSSTWDEVSPVYNDYKEFSLNDFYNELSLPYSKTLSYKVINATSTGRIREVDINGNLIDAKEVVRLLGLRSNYFNIKQINNTICISTKGYGHGVGMSQYGAHGMALAGFSYDEILKHYYQGVNIKKI